MSVETIIEWLTKRSDKLSKQLEEQGGRGIKLADEIDRLNYAADALRGDLLCPCCDSKLTSNP